MEKLPINKSDYHRKLNDFLGVVILTVKFPERVIEFANFAIEDVFGYKPDECIGKNTQFLYPTIKDYRDLGRSLKSVVTEGKDTVRLRKICYKRRDGEVFSCDVTITFLKKNEEIVRAICILQDIAEYEYREELLQGRQFLEGVFDGIQDGISVLDRDLNIIKVNQTMLEWYPHSLPLTGKKCFNAYQGEAEPCTVCPTIRAIESGILQKDVVPFTGKNGRIGWMELFAFPLKDKNNYVTGVIEYVRDITERKKDEEKLHEQKKSLEQKNIALSEILGQLEIEKKQIKDNVIANAETLLLPIVERIRLKGESSKYVQLLQKTIQELTSSFGASLAGEKNKLTSREIEICNMIRNGMTSKEIASLLGISLGTTERHRNNIRRKFDIVNKDINLSSTLKTR